MHWRSILAFAPCRKLVMKEALSNLVHGWGWSTYTVPLPLWTRLSDIPFVVLGRATSSASAWLSVTEVRIRDASLLASSSGISVGAVGWTSSRYSIMISPGVSSTLHPSRSLHHSTAATPLYKSNFDTCRVCCHRCVLGRNRMLFVPTFGLCAIASNRYGSGHERRFGKPTNSGP